MNQMYFALPPPQESVAYTRSQYQATTQILQITSFIL